ncbi:hypothetical protein TomMM35A_33350 [Sphingobium sp. TomMM35A]
MDRFQHGLRLWQIAAPQGLSLALIIIGVAIEFAQGASCAFYRRHAQKVAAASVLVKSRNSDLRLLNYFTPLVALQASVNIPCK